MVPSQCLGYPHLVPKYVKRERGLLWFSAKLSDARSRTWSRAFLLANCSLQA